MYVCFEEQRQRVLGLSGVWENRLSRPMHRVATLGFCFVAIDHQPTRPTVCTGSDALYGSSLLSPHFSKGLGQARPGNGNDSHF